MRTFLLGLVLVMMPSAWAADPNELLSRDFSVTANSQPLTVYEAKVDSALDVADHYAFASFDLTTSTTVSIKPTHAFKQVEVRPAIYGIMPKIVDGVISITLDKPCQISVECDGIRLPLFIFADAPEVDIPAVGDPQVIRFGPGVHRPENGQIILTSGQTLYLERGAIVQAGVIVKNAEHVRIAGRGMLDGTPWAHVKGPTWVFIEIKDCSHVRLEGIILRGSYHWNVVPIATNNVTISGIKICAGRVQNDDGINPCNSSDVRIQDCFIRTDDDCFALKGKFDDQRRPCERIAINNCVVWGDRARILLIGHESQAPAIRDIQVTNIQVLAYNDRAPILIEPGEDMTVENVTLSDWTIDARMTSGDLLLAQPIVNEYMLNKIPGRIHKLTLERIAMTSKPGVIPGIRLNGVDADYDVREVLLHTITANGQLISYSSLVLGDHVSSVSVTPEGTPAPSPILLPLISMGDLVLGGDAVRSSTITANVKDERPAAVLTIRDHDGSSWGVEARFPIKTHIRPNDRLRLSGFVRCLEPPEEGDALLEFQVQRDTSPWVKSLMWRCAPTDTWTPFEQVLHSPIGISPGLGKVSLLFYQREQVLEIADVSLVNLGPAP